MNNPKQELKYLKKKEAKQYNFYFCPPIGMIGASFCSPGLNVKISPAGIFLT
jgi:hypothetical protein